MKIEIKFIIATIIAILLTSCGLQATYTSPKTGIKYTIYEGEKGKPKLLVNPPNGGFYDQDGLVIEKSK